MTVDTFRQLVRRTPFEPFTIHMSDGRKLPITHPDFVFLPPQWRSSEIIVAFPDGKWDFVYLRNITTISSQGPHPASPEERKGDSESE